LIDFVNSDQTFGGYWHLLSNRQQVDLHKTAPSACPPHLCQWRPTGFCPVWAHV